MTTDVIVPLLILYAGMYLPGSCMEPSYEQTAMANRIFKVFNISYDNTTDTVGYYDGEADLELKASALQMTFAQKPINSIMPCRLSEFDLTCLEDILNSYPTVAPKMGPIFETIGYIMHQDGDFFRLTYIGDPNDNTIYEWTKLNDIESWKDVDDGLDTTKLPKWL